MSKRNPAPDCVCGFRPKNGNRAAFANHARVCDAEQARSRAFVRAVEEGRPQDAHRDAHAAAQSVLASSRASTEG